MMALLTPILCIIDVAMLGVALGFGVLYAIRRCCVSHPRNERDRDVEMALGYGVVKRTVQGASVRSNEVQGNWAAKMAVRV